MGNYWLDGVWIDTDTAETWECDQAGTDTHPGYVQNVCRLAPGVWCVEVLVDATGQGAYVYAVTATEAMQMLTRYGHDAGV